MGLFFFAPIEPSQFTGFQPLDTSTETPIVSV